MQDWTRTQGGQTPLRLAGRGFGESLLLPFISQVLLSFCHPIPASSSADPVAHRLLCVGQQVPSTTAAPVPTQFSNLTSDDS